MRIEIEREEDGRWIAEVPDLPGVMAYGRSREDAIAKAQAFALRVIADRPNYGDDAEKRRTSSADVADGRRSRWRVSSVFLLPRALYT